MHERENITGSDVEQDYSDLSSNIPRGAIGVKA